MTVTMTAAMKQLKVSNQMKIHQNLLNCQVMRTLISRLMKPMLSSSSRKGINVILDNHDEELVKCASFK